MYLKGLRPAILNLADDSFPTGCVATGSTAQEESLCRSSTLSKHIDIKFHFIRDHIKNKNIIVKWLPTAKQEADILTKAMVTKQFNLLVSKNLLI